MVGFGFFPFFCRDSTYSALLNCNMRNSLVCTLPSGGILVFSTISKVLSGRPNIDPLKRVFKTLKIQPEFSFFNNIQNKIPIHRKNLLTLAPYRTWKLGNI
jgi:hypothetical protein